MKSLIHIFVFIGLLSSCNLQNVNWETVEPDSSYYNKIDTIWTNKSNLYLLSFFKGKQHIFDTFDGMLALKNSVFEHKCHSIHFIDLR